MTSDKTRRKNSLGSRHAVLLFAAGLLSVFALGAEAQKGSAAGTTLDRPPLPGINRHDRRIVVDPTQRPWNVIVKVQTNIGGKCTGFLIDRRRVLTAAHCLWNPRTQAMLRPVSLHVLFGYRRDRYTKHVLVRSYRTAADFDGAAPLRRPGADWARLDLAARAPKAVQPLPLAADLPRPGTPVALAGYNQDRAQLLLADLSCRITARTVWRGARLLIDDCSATRGTSGAPLLIDDGAAGWAVLGMNIAASRHGNLALPASDLRAAIK